MESVVEISVPIVDDDDFSHVFTNMLPPITTFGIQATDAGIEKSFKAIFWRLLMSRLLSFKDTFFHTSWEK